MDSSAYLLQMKGIRKEFPGVKALIDVDLNVQAGSVVALVGENGAGKSTLMNVLFGIYIADGGEMLLNGQPYNPKHPRDALDHGIAMVHQELNQVRDLSVYENVWLGRFLMKGITVDKKGMIERTAKIFKDLEIDIDPKVLIKDLSVSKRQMVEIAKAVSCDAKIIVFDEPTSSLTEVEVNHLFRIIAQLKAKGCGIVYISHKLEEIFSIADEILILRDGKWIHNGRCCDLNLDKIITLIVGRELTQRFPEKDTKPSEEVLLSVKNLSGLYDPAAKDISFDLHHSEILGVSGLVGSKRTEMLESLFGLRTKASGNLELIGQAVFNRNPRESIRNKFSIVTEDRRESGIFPMLDVYFNSVVANLNKYSNSIGVLDETQMVKDANWVISAFNVKTPNMSAKINNLSGGNQQKVLMGRWLLTDPLVLLFDEPTRGIDVGAKFEIYQLILDCTRKGNGVIFVSSEMPELLGLTDRILVMSNGRVAGIVKTCETNQEELLRLSAKYL